MIRNSSKNTPEDNPIEQHVLSELQQIILLLKNKTNYDFSFYKPKSLIRSILRRLDNLQIDTIHSYVHYLHHYPSEIPILLKCLLIHVTHFFRDPDAFELLKQQLLATLSALDLSHGCFRVWIPGCSTGEEVYSVAILLQECKIILNREFEVRIFGTDLDANVIETARAGVFTSRIEKHVSADRLKAFFIKNKNTYKIAPNIRKTTVFSVQNIISAPAFTKLNLICCRNLLIYLDARLQNKTLLSFYSGLQAKGLLLLGASENIGSSSPSFNTIDPKWKLYERKEREHLVPTSTNNPLTEPSSPMKSAHMIGNTMRETESKLSVLLKEMVVKNYTPAFIVIDEKGDIVYIYGRTSKFLELAPGEGRLHFMSMIRPELKPMLHLGVRKASIQKKEISFNGLHLSEPENNLYVNVKISPINLNEDDNQSLILVIIEEIAASEALLMRNSSSDVHSHIQHALNEKTRLLVDELEQIKLSYQTIIEELESSNEELQSINEEAQATNEELQSLNEELSKMNIVLENRIDHLITAKEDIKNLLQYTDIATLCLDKNLCIKRYTPKIKDIMNLIPSDMGRPVTDFVANLQHQTLISDIRTALSTIETVETENVDTSGKAYLIKIIPYRSSSNAVGGVVITFLNRQSQKIMGGDELTVLPLLVGSS